MTTFSPLSIPLNQTRCYLFTKSQQPIKFSYLNCSKIVSFYQNNGFLFRFSENKSGVLWVKEKSLREKRVLKVKGFGFNGGGGGKVDGKVLGNIGLAVGLTYLTLTGQLGWVLDTIVSIWLIAVIVPVVGIGVFLWWAGRDMIISNCPNCGNAFQVFKSTINDELQLCPFCTQPFSVQGNDFVKEPIQFSSKRSSAFGQFDDFTPWTKKGKDTSKVIVDVEAEVKDAD